jgi:ribonuclease HI
LVRNFKIFENKSTISTIVAFKAIGIFKNWKEIYPVTRKKKTLNIFFFTNKYSTGWFDGATQQSGALSGASGLIQLSKNSIYKWTLFCGPSTNIRVELMGARATLHLASRLHIDKLHMKGDSKVIINWLNNQGKLQISTLLAWKDKIIVLKQLFKDLSYSHSLSYTKYIMCKLFIVHND